MEIRDTRNGEWHWVNNAVVACKHITHAEKCVYSSLCTFGGCKEIHPSFDLIAEKSNVTKRMVMKAVKRLIEVGYVSVKKGGGRGNANVYDLLKVPKGCTQCTVYEKGEQKNTVYSGQERVNKKTIKGEQNSTPIDKELDKELDKVATPSVADQIKELIYLFKEVNPSYEELFKNKTERAAAERLIRRFGFEKICGSIEKLPEIINKKFAPKVTTPYQFERRLGELIAFMKQERSDAKIIPII